jgi:3-phosphoshikimate 1-carboxyvinyltransferase
MNTAFAEATGESLRAFPSGPLHGSVTVPGDKSMSHRALILGALAQGVTEVTGLLESRDVLHTAAAVRAFGAKADKTGSGSWRIEGREWHSPTPPINCGNSGTAARLLMGAAAGFPISATFTGDASLKRRPMARVLEPLRHMGAKAEGSTLPLTLHGGGLRGISYVNETGSAQVKSAILLAGLRAEGEVEIVEPAPSRDHSEDMLRAFGCEVDAEQGRIRLGARRKLLGTSLSIPGDPSSAAFPNAAALVVPGSAVTIRAVMTNPLRTGLLASLQEMGASVRSTNERAIDGERVADLLVGHSQLRGVDVPASRAPAMIDEYPILAIMAAFARGTTAMHGLAELRVKESDRLAAIVQGLRRCGVDAREEGDSLIVQGCDGPPPGGAAVETFEDHRIAMSFLVLGLGARAPVAVNGAGMIATSFPGFASLMRSLGARIE